MARGTLKRWLKRLGFTGVGLLGVLALFVAVEQGRGRRMLNRRLSTLEARGEILTVEALEPERAALAENAFQAVLSLSNALATVATNVTLPPAMRFVAPGRALVTAKLEQWSRDEDGPFNWAQVEQYLEGMEGTLAALRSAAELPAYDSGFDYRKGFVDFQLAPVAHLRNAAQLLSVATLCNLHRSELARAHANLVALTKLAMNQTPEPLVILQLIRYVCVGIAFETMWQALQAPGWSDEELAVLQSAWTGADFPGDLGRALEMERAMTLDLYRQGKDSYATLKRIVGQREGAVWSDLMGRLPTEGFWLHWAHLPFYRVAWMDQDTLRSLNRWQHLIERERAARTGSWSALADPSADHELLESMPLFKEADELRWYDRLRYLLSGGVFGINEGIASRPLLFQTQRELVLTALSVSRYRARRGTEPPDLQALVPDLLVALPKDWMNGESLRYRGRPQGGFLLHSVGQDGKDNGGDPAPWETGAGYRQVLDGKDLVWPLAATAEGVDPG